MEISDFSATLGENIKQADSKGVGVVTPDELEPLIDANGDGVLANSEFNTFSDMLKGIQQAGELTPTQKETTLASYAALRVEQAAATDVPSVLNNTLVSLEQLGAEIESAVLSSFVDAARVMNNTKAPLSAMSLEAGLNTMDLGVQLGDAEMINAGAELLQFFGFELEATTLE